MSEQGTEAVDPALVKPFEKITRVTGLLIVGAFLVWGLSYDWDYRNSPFSAFFRAGKFYGGELTFIMSFAVLVIAVAGWFLRFLIGNVFYVSIFGILGLLRSLFGKV